MYNLLGNLHGNLLKIELIKEHNLGMRKYQSLKDAGNSIHIPTYKGIDDNLLLDYQNQLKKCVDVPVEICKI